jgi:hypothetical protein
MRHLRLLFDCADGVQYLLRCLLGRHTCVDVRDCTVANEEKGCAYGCFLHGGLYDHCCYLEQVGSPPLFLNPSKSKPH